MEKNGNELIKEIIRDSKAAAEQFEGVKQRIENHPLWKENENMVIIDWNDGRDELLKKGMSVTETYSGEEWNLELQDHCVVRNFPAVYVKNARLTDCIFENCSKVTLSEGTAVRCVITQADVVYLDNLRMYDSTFRDIACCTGGLLISLEDSVLCGCSFRNVELKNDVYLADGVGDCLVEKCSFENVTTDRDDGELFRCEETVGKVFKRVREYDMVDRNSCVGLN